MQGLSKINKAKNYIFINYFEFPYHYFQKIRLDLAQNLILFLKISYLYKLPLTITYRKNCR